MPEAPKSNLKNAASSLQEVLITEQLSLRSSREPDYKSEVESIHGLTKALTDSPSSILQELVDAALKLCRADSAGISIAEVDGDKEHFRWCALAGRMSHLINATLPRYFSPCGEVLSQARPLLMKDPGKYYSFITDIDIPMEEVLLVPFKVNGSFGGTVWAISHQIEREFEAEDLRLLESLADFASVAYQAHHQLEQSETNAQLAEEAHHQLRDYLMQAPNPLVILEGKEFRYALANKPYEKFIGRKVQGRKLSEVFDKGELDAFIPLLNQVYSTGVPYIGKEHEVQLSDEHGGPTPKWVDVSYHPLRDRRDEIVGILASIHDVTYSVLARQKLIDDEVQLHAERAKLEAIFYGAESALALFVGEELVFEMANESYMKMISHREVMGKKLLEALPEVADSDFPRLMKQVYDTGEPLRVVEEHTQLFNPETGQLEDHYFTSTFARIDSISSNSHMVICHAMNVTAAVNSRRMALAAEIELTRLKDEAERARKELHSFFMQAPAPMVIFQGAEHRFMLANPLYEKYVGRRVQGKTVREVFTDEEIGYYIPLLDRVFQTGEPYVGRELPLKLQDDEGGVKELRINVSYTPTRDDSNNITGILVFVQDVTEEFNARQSIERHNRDLTAAKEEAERANSLKSAFLANMSHEIRTPLGAMLGFADLLRDPDLTSTERNNFINVLTRNGESLSVIINDILDLSKVEAGHLSLEYTEVDIEQLGLDIVSLLKVKAAEKDLALEFTFDKNSDFSTLVTDPTRLRQILLNLVGNAIKFTRFGTVNLHAYRCMNVQGKNSVCFEISDTGIGIPAHQHEQVFEMFVQADGTMTRRFGGTGLGLSLSRRLARALGGDISIVKSQLGVGTHFLVHIEDQPHSRKTLSYKDETRTSLSKNLSEAALQGLKVLVVDDAPDNQQLIWRYLTKRGAIVESVENGMLGYRAALIGDFDLVLMDIQMPVMDGYTATQMLRDNGYRKPIIALTAHAMTEVRKKALNVGYTDHLTKPINANELIQTILIHTQ